MPQIGPFAQALFFLTDTVFTLYILAILLRILLQWVRADFYNPFCQFIVTLTNPVFVFARRFIPGYGGIDWAGIVLLLIFSFIKQAVLWFIQTKILANGVGLLLLSIADILRQTFYIYMFSTFALLIMSWLRPASHHPMLKIVYQLLTPPLKKIRQYIPDVAGFDLSPMVLMVVLVLINILIIQVIAGMGYTLIIDQ